MRSDKRSAGLYLFAGLQRLALGWMSSRVRERQRVSAASRVLRLVQMRESLQVRRERRVPGRQSSSEVHLSKSKTPLLYPSVSLRTQKKNNERYVT